MEEAAARRVPPSASWVAVGKWPNPTEAVSSSVKSFGEVSLLEESRKEQALTLGSKGIWVLLY